MSTLGTLIPDNDHAAGYCSSATRPLTAAQIARVVRAANSGGAVGVTKVWTEKELVDKGTRRLVMIQEGGEFSSNFILVEYAGVRKAKFVSKDAERFEAMIEGALEKLGESFDGINATKIVLLKENGTICRRNTLTRLHRNNIVVMRCTNDADEEDSDSE